MLLVVGAASIVPGPRMDSKFYRRLKRTFTPFLTLADARTLLQASEQIPERPPVVHDEQSEKRMRRRVLQLTVPISVLSLLEMIAWMTLIAYYLSLGNFTFGLVSMIMTVSWIYAFVKTLVRPVATPPYDIAILLLVQLGTGMLGFFGHAYDAYAYSKRWPGKWVLASEIADLVIIIILLGLIFHAPLEAIDERDIDPHSSPEDYASIWGWMTFAFVNPLVETVSKNSRLHLLKGVAESEQGSRRPLNEDDVFELSPHHRAAPLLNRWSETKGKNLVRKIWAINSLDLMYGSSFIQMGF